MVDNEVDGSSNVAATDDNKRKRHNNTNTQQSNNSNGGVNNDNNKRNKKKRKKNNNPNQSNKPNKSTNNNNNHHKKKKQQQQHKRKRNWIENCSESINRIPINSIAPLVCVVSRVELEEEPLLPTGGVKQKKMMSGDGDGGTGGGGGGTVDGTKGDDEAVVVSVDTEEEGMVDEPRADVSNDKFETAVQSTTETSKHLASNTSFTTPCTPWKVATTINVDGKDQKIFVPVKRHPSSIGPTKWLQSRQQHNHKKQQQPYIHLPNGDNGDGITNPYPNNLVPDKFWAQRKRLFSRYDEGIQIGGMEDPEMWYSVTPESIAGHVAERMVGMVRDCRKSTDVGDDKEEEKGANNHDIVIVDVFCGCGGNSIAFARMNSADTGSNDVPIPLTKVKVIAVDNDLSRLKMAANNAKVYGISSEDITFVHADAVDVIRRYKEGVNLGNDKSERTTPERQPFSGYVIEGVESLPNKIDGIFLSPPWGGLGYEDEGNFDPIVSISIESSSREQEQKTIINGGELFDIASKAVFRGNEGILAYFLPRNTNGVVVGQIAVTSGLEGSFEMEQNVVNGKVKTITAYFGSCVGKSND